MKTPSFSFSLVSLVLALLATLSGARAGPIYEPIVAFRPRIYQVGNGYHPHGSSLIRHSSGDFYGSAGHLLFRVTPAGAVTAMGESPRGNVRQLAETSDGRLVGFRRWEGKLKGPTFFAFDPQTERVSELAVLSTVSALSYGFRLQGGLVSDGFGFIWGVAEKGGAAGRGAIFKVHEKTGSVSLIYSFPDAPGQAGITSEPLFPDGRGRLWGTNSTRRGGAAVFRVDARSGVYKQIASGTQDPRLFGTGPLALDTEGNLWCTALGRGVVRVNPPGDEVTVVAELPPPFGYSRGDTGPRRMVDDGAGYMWGTTELGSLGGGSIFKVNKSSGELHIIAEFPQVGPDALGYHGRQLGELINDGFGSLWVTAQRSGAFLRIDIATSELTEFPGVVRPSFHLVLDDTGHLWGSDSRGVFKINAATAEVTLFTEGFGTRDPRVDLAPGTELVSGKDGSLWGLGSSSEFRNGAMIYKVDPITWTKTVVVEFTGQDGPRPGGYLSGPLAADPAGNLWGLVAYPDGSPWPKRRVVFKLDPFTGELLNVAELPDEVRFYDAMVHDGFGSFWGKSGRLLVRIDAATGVITTFPMENLGSGERLISDGLGFLWGIQPSNGEDVPATIFKVDIHSGEASHVITFGRIPVAPDTLESDGHAKLWGTVGIGPLGRNPNTPKTQPGFGAVFKIDAATDKLKYVHNFRGPSVPIYGVNTENLVTDQRGNFFGVVPWGGTRRLGSIFSFNQERFKTLFEFTGNKGKVPGARPHPVAQRVRMLVHHTDGNLYGSTLAGGVLPDGNPAGGGQFYRIRFGPTPVTLPAEVVSSTSAILRGTINPNGVKSGVFFEYGTDAQMQTFFTAGAGELPARKKPKFVSLEISGLAPGETYYFRVVGQNPKNTQPQRGEISSFSTPTAE